MKLPFFNKEKKKDYFLSVLLRDEKVEAVIFEEQEGKITLIGEGYENLGDSIENLSEEELLIACDKSITDAETSLPPKLEINKTIFGLKENWIQDDKIKKEFLEKLKKLSESLGLSPVGFLVVHDAIAHMLSHEEGAPVSAILVEVGDKNLAISLLRAGKIIETKRAKIEDSVPKTTDRLLHHFQYEVLPSKIIIFNGENADNLSYEFTSYSFSKSLPFLHMPKTSVLVKGFDSKAIVFGVAKQMGFDVLNIKPQKIKEETLRQVGDQKEKDVENKEQVENKIEKNEEPEKEEEMEEDTGTQTESFGFVVNGDVAKTLPKEEDLEDKETDEKKLDLTIDTPSPSPLDSLKKGVPKTILNIFFLFIKSFLNILLTMFKFLLKILSKKTASAASLSVKRSKFILLIPVVPLILIALFVFYLFNLKAEVVVYVAPKIIEETYDITFSTKPKDSKGVVLGESISIKEEGSVSQATTGKKEIGDKAKGTVTIFNKTLESKTFPQGTIIKAPNGLEFSINDSITVSSASGDIFSPTTPGTTKAQVTALDIGKEYNLPSGTTFNIGSLTNIAAKNDTAFSGGSKKEINVVSKNDQDKLAQELPKKLQNKAKEDALKKVAKGQEILPFLLNQEFEKKNFSKNVGDESNNLTLSANLSYDFVSYKKSSLEEYLKNVLNEKAKNLKLSDSGVSFSIEKLDKKNDSELDSKVKAKASFLPRIDEKSLSQKIKGKSQEEADEILSSIPQFQSTEISFKPNLPFVPKSLPRVSKNIMITLRTNE